MLSISLRFLATLSRSAESVGAMRGALTPSILDVATICKLHFWIDFIVLERLSSATLSSVRLVTKRSIIVSRSVSGCSGTGNLDEWGQSLFFLSLLLSMGRLKVAFL